MVRGWRSNDEPLQQAMDAEPQTTPILRWLALIDVESRSDVA